MSQWIDFDPEDVIATQTFTVQGRPIRQSTVWVNRQTARMLLKMNVHNRAVSRRAIDQLVRDIKSGKWVYTGDSARFSADNIQLDAQHRLMAIDEADGRVPMLIIEGLDPAAADLIDQVRRRSVPDILRFRGVDINLVSTCVSAAGLLMQAEDLDAAPTRQMIADYVEEHAEELQRVAQWAKSMSDQSPYAHTRTRTNSRSMSPGPLTALVVHMFREGANPRLVQEFIEGVATGLSRTDEDRTTYNAIRRRVEEVPLFAGGGGSQNAYLLTEGFEVFIRCYNRWVEGKTIKVVKSSPKGKRVMIRSYDSLTKPSTRATRPGQFSLTSESLTA